ncbi:unnamed protein product [Arabidopsis halleri]
MEKKFTWVLEKFSSLQDKRCYSRPFTVAGYNCEFVSLTKFREKGEGFLVNNRLIILAEVHVLPAIVLPVEPVKIADPLSSKGGNQAADASVNDDATSEEGSDDDASEEGSDDDDVSEEDPNVDGVISSPVSDDGAETEVSNCENDDAPKDDVDDEASSHVSNDSANNGSSLDQEKSLEDASQTVENGARRFNTVASVTGTEESSMEKYGGDKKFTWVLKYPTSFRVMTSDTFVIDGCNWRLSAMPSVDNVYLYLVVPIHQSMSYEWKRCAKYRLTVVNHLSKELFVGEGLSSFDQSTYVSSGEAVRLLTKIYYKDGGFLRSGELKIVAELALLYVRYWQIRCNRGHNQTSEQD